MENFWTSLKIICLLKLVSANPENFTLELFRMTNEISNQYFQVFKCVTFITEDPGNVRYLEIRLPIILIHLSGDNFGGRLSTETFEQGCGGFIIQTTSRKMILRELVEAKGRAEKNRYNKERYLFLPCRNNDTDLSVLHHPSLYFLPNTLLVRPSKHPSQFTIYHHTTFDPEERKAHVIVDTWSSEGFTLQADLYPDKLKNVKGKKIVFAVTHYVPYSMLMSGGEVDGLDVRIAAQFSDFIGGSWTILDHPIHQWGIKFPNGSGNGIFGSVQSHRADIGFGGFFQWYCDVLDCSYPYLHSEVTCLVPKPQILSGWLTIFLPFSASAWIGLSTAFFIGASFVFLLNLADDHMRGIRRSPHVPSGVFHALYMMFRLHILQIPATAFKPTILATYIKVTTVYYFFVVVFWQGGIASILTVPRYENPINNAYDLVSRWPKVKWGADHKAWINSIENSTDPVLQNIVKKFEILDKDGYNLKIKSRDFGYFIETLSSGHYGFTDLITEEALRYLRLMNEYIYNGYAVFILPRGSPFTEKLDHIIHWMFSTGIIQKMEVQVYLNRINNRLQNMIRYSNEKEAVHGILAIRHIEGSLYIYCGGIIISTLILIAENIFFRLGKTDRHNLSINEM